VSYTKGAKHQAAPLLACFTTALALFHNCGYGDKATSQLCSSLQWYVILTEFCSAFTVIGVVEWLVWSSSSSVLVTSIWNVFPRSRSDITQKSCKANLTIIIWSRCSYEMDKPWSLISFGRMTLIHLFGMVNGKSRGLIGTKQMSSLCASSSAWQEETPTFPPVVSFQVICFWKWSSKSHLCRKVRVEMATDILRTFGIHPRSWETNGSTDIHGP